MSLINFDAMDAPRRVADNVEGPNFNGRHLKKLSKGSPGTTVIAVRTRQLSLPHASTLYAMHLGTCSGIPPGTPLISADRSKARRSCTSKIACSNSFKVVHLTSFKAASATDSIEEDEDKGKAIAPLASMSDRQTSL
jgi:hypothetical protein